MRGGAVGPSAAQSATALTVIPAANSASVPPKPAWSIAQAGMYSAGTRHSLIEAEDAIGRFVEGEDVRHPEGAVGRTCPRIGVGEQADNRGGQRLGITRR